MWCEIKFTLGHRCVKAQLYQIFTEEREDNNNDTKKLYDYVNNLEEIEEEDHELQNRHAISPHALIGVKGYMTIRLYGRIKNQLVKCSWLILKVPIISFINPTYNFIY